MARVRDCWLETLSTCVTVVLVGIVYTVLAGYAAGPPFGGQQVSERGANPGWKFILVPAKGFEPLTP